MKKIKSYILLILSFCSIFSVKAQIVLPRILGHNMVFQQKKPIHIWGKASVGEQINVQFSGQSAKTTADSEGNWQVWLKALPATSIPQELRIEGKEVITLKNILIGEVWLCSGQSNMEYTMRKNSKVKRPNLPDPNPVDELEVAKNPLIRIFLVNRKELVKPDPQHKGWSIAQDSALRSFSAVAYFFAKEVHQQTGVPIGMISSAIPGSRIEPWISEEAFASSPYFKGQKIEGEPAKFYNPMIRPLESFVMKGFLWYQGESNCFLKDSVQYTNKMETLISSWRKAWKDDKMPFYYVQLVPYLYSKSTGKVVLDKETLPTFWQAQANVTQRVKYVDFVTTTDLADTLTNIHPWYKWEIGKRLALLALKHDYEKKDLVTSGPIFQKMKIKNDKAILSFDSMGGGLMSKDGKDLNYFSLAGADGIFHEAKAIIVGTQVEVFSEKIPEPKTVRFAWQEDAEPNFFNKEGLPARPFTSKK
ncbi:sialate O-acetylesterase [Flectobacillus sp. DC10W]|uniref:Sialate O-acetylesterase n=1 Tax=Flectobacillus longus TaxID=2984207 RepID=A0ABT6YQ60_9BACT|nr:sialate O-acetylesterase [Flectobacillus longus]MDI9865660.1 sialate O-acetylesterase [Flectobacillus longus]